MTSMKIVLASATLACAAALPAAAQQITGAGATFPAPVYTKWGEAAKAAIGVELNYQAIGSGGGQNQILNRTVDFGASDAPMDAAKLQSGNLVQFPMVMGAVVPIVNLPGIAADQLKLTGEILADIYAGKITKWNDPKLGRTQRGREPAQLRDRAGAPRRRLRHVLRVHSYLSADEPGLEAEGGREHQRELAGRHGRARQRRRSRDREERPGRDRLRRERLCDAEPPDDDAAANKGGEFVKPTMEASRRRRPAPTGTAPATMRSA